MYYSYRKGDLFEIEELFDIRCDVEFPPPLVAAPPCVCAYTLIINDEVLSENRTIEIVINVILIVLANYTFHIFLFSIIFKHTYSEVILNQHILSGPSLNQ